MAPTLGHPWAAADPSRARQPPELPGEECQSLRGAVLVSSPGGLMSAYGDILNPLECTRTRRRPIPPAVGPVPWSTPSTLPTLPKAGRATTGRLARLSAAPRTAPSLTPPPNPS